MIHDRHCSFMLTYLSRIKHSRLRVDVLYGPRLSTNVILRVFVLTEKEIWIFSNKSFVSIEIDFTKIRTRNINIGMENLFWMK